MRTVRATADENYLTPRIRNSEKIGSTPKCGVEPWYY